MESVSPGSGREVESAPDGELAGVIDEEPRGRAEGLSCCVLLIPMLSVVVGHGVTAAAYERA